MIAHSHPARVVLVEGPSDVAAVRALARRRHVELNGQIAVVDIGGATNVRRAVAEWAPNDIFGMCDVGELRYYRRVLPDGRVFVCDLDLEDELIRAAGADLVQHVIADNDEIESFKSFQRQPAQRGRPIEAQLRRFMGTKSRRKIRYGSLLVDALELDRVPQPLDGLLEAIAP